MYALRDYLGEDIVNRSLRRLLSLRGFSTDPFALSKDFLEIVKEEAGPEHLELIRDLFERITLVDLQAGACTVQRTSDGRYSVAIDVRALKYYADSAGEQRESVFDFPVDIGIFTRNPADHSFNPDDIVYFQKHELDSGASRVELTVDRAPTYAGIDPYHKLIDRVPQDNLCRIVGTGSI
jgi:hypothetical protein